jgi:hypothetical protein
MAHVIADVREPGSGWATPPYVDAPTWWDAGAVGAHWYSVCVELDEGPTPIGYHRYDFGMNWHELSVVDGQWMVCFDCAAQIDSGVLIRPGARWVWSHEEETS